ncbi:P-loop containing nucleoside triphosphate hydrolase protein [Saccharata proteae CBS 121410]|uniref:P-loop containing nucleoside triphosphate hydrolase protein n=1 Tax=Saccharata proteae CBS 121410 TaxID=1314787 RepID=A0A9P4HRM6_9PEZI|nr:P-loop containing nucleoside triphosphate hydrolase protein [Saccharata proteae CBS 121410]
MSHQFSNHSNRLHRLFMRIIDGQLAITPQYACQLIEAILDRKDPVSCVEKLISSKKGLEALKTAISMNTSVAFVNKSATDLIQYFRAPALKHVCGGEYMQKIVQALVDPPVFWNKFVDHARSGLLDNRALNAFGWLLLQQLVLSSDQKESLRNIAQDGEITARLIGAADVDTRNMGAKVKHMIDLTSSAAPFDPNSVAGGRHDNDFAEFRNINILPTADEIDSTEHPFLRRAVDVDDMGDNPLHLPVHIDNQFRLLREDMLRGLKEDLQIALGKIKGRRRVSPIENLVLHGVDCGEPRRWRTWGLQLRCQGDFPIFKGCHTEEARRKMINDKRNVDFLKAQSLAALFADGELVTLVNIQREEELLAKCPPIVCVRISDPSHTRKFFLRLQSATRIGLLQLNTAVFAYEPVLKRLQNIRELSLSKEIVFWNSSSDTCGTPPAFEVSAIQVVIREMENHPQRDLKLLLGLKKNTVLDAPQAKCLIATLSQRLSLIQGPPGTGKSFLGALAAKTLYGDTKEKILVVCYTHHALDQFLDDLLKVGIPASDIIRLGATDRSTDSIKALSLFAKKRGKGISRDRFTVLDKLEAEVFEISQELKSNFASLRSLISGKFSLQELFDFLDFESDDPMIPAAFILPDQEDGMTVVGKGGKSVEPSYLFDRWASGHDAGIFEEHVITFKDVWSLDPGARIEMMESWKSKMVEEQVDSFTAIADSYNSVIESKDRVRNQSDSDVIGEKRIIGCTTTAAAKYSQAIQQASPGIVIVEEAGEILESHIITALSPETQHLILIGDHKQLRPKCEYDLSVEKDNGYDLNRSLFERMVLKGFPHHVLSQQHRMRPEISSLIRNLTYPDLIDAPSTLSHPDLRGFQRNLIFVTHSQPEDSDTTAEPEWQAMSRNSSKKNTFEAKMVLKCVRYLGQQGYGTDDLVVLTPYLGQLRLLMDVLGKENDPVLNDLDSHDLIKAGLMTPLVGLEKKRKIKMSTIDNYQGQESDIVVLSLTRSNTRGDIGFMSSPERLNVALSRARNALIMIGNPQTFLESRKGRDLWKKFINLLEDGGCVHAGFPIKCEQHPDRTAIVTKPAQFDTDCPDGGCMMPCGVTLSCGVHVCPSRCHQLSDHSKMACEHLVQTKCPRGHKRTSKCSFKHLSTCPSCEREDKKRNRELKEQEKRDEQLADHAAQIAAIEDEIRDVRERAANQKRVDEMSKALRQKELDLDSAKRITAQALNLLPSPSTPVTGQETDPAKDPAQASQIGTQDSTPAITVAGANPSKPKRSASRDEWERQKRFENASNDAIDSLMDMTGLEDVKAQVLKIKARLDTAKRQGTDLSQERFGIVLLGNPGTGKTTVARHYARFLASIGVLPGGSFFETTGSRLANDGVSGARKHVEGITKAGGGAFFLDEAYQLSEGNNAGGTAVLDFLLAEVENQTGKIVFILAGYNKQMESFFKHNPGFTSRFPYTLQFADYTDEELLEMFGAIIAKKFRGKMKVEDGVDGLYARIVTRRLGRGRGRDGFGNARALHNVFAKVSERQADRLQRERVAGKAPDDFLLTKEDLIGPQPTNAIANSAAWKDIQGLIGLASVKKSIQSLLNSITKNYMRELKEKTTIQVSLNRVFLGPPGTGKTSVGKLYGQVLADLGLLSSSEVIVKNPSDFVGAHIGSSEQNTKAILAASQGKVLIIDEAYMLSGGEGNQTDPYRTAVVDTIVAEVQSTPGEDRCVLLLGYREQMVQLFNNTNPGLARRFPLENAFVFEDFDDDELRRIFDLKLKSQELGATPQAKDVAIAVLSRERMRPNFGNGGAVENLIGRAKAAQQIRESCLPLQERSEDVIFEPQDFDPDFDRAKRASANCRELFKGVIGQEDVMVQLEEYQQIAAGMRARGLDPRSNIPFNFIFKGPPGTGKTTTARKVGQVFYDMGFLSSIEVTECSVSNLIGQYIGHTAPKVIKMLEKALGGILFIDEAYRLGEGPFATEAVDELVDSLTKERFMNKIIVILAGYESDMNQLLTRNPGLSSRFPAEITFKSLPPERCLQLIHIRLEKLGITVEGLSEDKSSEYREKVLDLFRQLASLPSWGNGRDIETLAKTISGSVFKKLALSHAGNNNMSVATSDIVRFLGEMLAQRQARGNTSSARAGNGYSCPSYQRHSPNVAGPRSQTEQQQKAPSQDRPPVQQSQTQQDQKKDETRSDSPLQEADEKQRDEGVSDAIWQQLQEDQRGQEDLEKVQQAELKGLEESVQRAALKESAAEMETELLELKDLQNADKNDDRDREAELCKLAHEKARLALLKAKKERERREEELRRAREETERKRKEEARVQQKLRMMGVCCRGFRWIKQSQGYRCAGGFHYVSNDQLGVQ